MAISKSIQSAVALLNKNNAPEKLRELGASCVFAAYKGDTEPAQYALDNLTQWARLPLAKWLKARGLEIPKLDVGGARLIVNGIKDVKRQAKAFQEAATLPVLLSEHAVKQPKKEKELKGSAGERMDKAVTALIKRLKNEDPDAAALLNDVWCAKLDAAIKREERTLKVA